MDKVFVKYNKLVPSLINMQDNLNYQVCGEKWTNGVCNKTGKNIYWFTAIIVELGELFESYGYKHWKDQKQDLTNVEIELVDIYHFIISILLSKYNRNLVNDLLMMQSHKVSAYKHNIRNTKCYEEQLKRFLEFLIDIDSPLKATGIIIQFVGLCNILLGEDGFEIVINKYMYKNVLNIFRNKNGYTDGTYIKDWLGKEDNVVLEEITKNNPDILPDDLYSKLEEKYAEVITSNVR